MRLRGGGGGHRRGGAEGALLGAGPAPQRRLLCEGISGGDHRGLSGRSRLGLRLPGALPHLKRYFKKVIASNKMLPKSQEAITWWEA